MVGEPGVGKTAVVEGLALRIAANEVPSALQGVQIHRRLPTRESTSDGAAAVFYRVASF